jgi:hypothetical protein
MLRMWPSSLLDCGFILAPQLSFLVLAAVALGGCAFVVGSRPVALPDGTQGFEIRCNGAARSGDTADVGGAVAPMGNGAVGIRALHRTLLVRGNPYTM